MTILTQPMSDKKFSSQKEPLVEGELPLNGTDGGQENDVEANRNPLLVTMIKTRARRVSSLTTICVFLTALLVFTTGIIGGIYLYREFTKYKLRHFRGWCSVPYSLTFNTEHLENENQIGMKSALRTMNDMDKAMNDLFESMSSIRGSKLEGNDLNHNVYNSFFDEEFDLDVENEQYERIEVPDFSHGRRGRFIHDFSVNKTGIIDLEEGRCFVIPLNRTTVLPPLSLLDMIVKMRSGYYDVDTEVVRESYRVVTPAVSDYKVIGYYIARECSNLPTYWLEKVPSPVFKRSVTDYELKTIFAEFAGHKINEIQIINLHKILGHKK